MTLFTLKLPEPCPQRVSRRRGAELLTLAGFETTHRTVANWKLPEVLINGRQTIDTHELFAEAQRRTGDD